MGDVVQEPVSLEVGGVPVRGLSYRPAGAARGGLVLCDPFAEEKKSAESTLAALGRALAGAGFWAWHFDYRGTGDSGGSFEQFDLAAWREDLRAAMHAARADFGVERVGLLGLRLGATLAAQVAEEVRPCCLILWEPIWEGERYVRELRQRTTIKGMLTAEGTGLGPASNAGPRAAPPAEGMDLGGYLLTPQLLGQLEALRLSPSSRPEIPLLLIECNARGRVSAQGRALVTGRPQAQAQALILPPFWQRVGLVDTSALVAATMEWLYHV